MKSTHWTWLSIPQWRLIKMATKVLQIWITVNGMWKKTFKATDKYAKENGKIRDWSYFLTKLSHPKIVRNHYTTGEFLNIYRYIHNIYSRNAYLFPKKDIENSIHGNPFIVVFNCLYFYRLFSLIQLLSLPLLPFCKHL